MKETIRDLYNRDVSIAEEAVPDSEEYRELQKAASDLEMKFNDCLSSDQKKLYEDILFICNRLHSQENEEHFISGFSLGLRLASESFLSKNNINKSLAINV